MIGHAAWWEIAAGVALDLLLGDPPRYPHPIRAVGRLISALESLARRTLGPTKPAGVLLWLVAVGVPTAVVAVTPYWLTIFWIWTFLALRSLDVESHAVIRALDREDLPEARRLLGRIVGRDTRDLDEPAIRRAVIETVSENLSDGVIAPLFYLVLGGPCTIAAFKCASTLDSMIGYRNPRYRELGWFSARADDVLNYIPARLSALLVWIASLLLGLDARRSLRTTLRDGSSQPSPNAGFPEAAFAGALGVQLGGPSTYQGQVSRKPHLGDPLRPLDRDVCNESRKLLYATSLLAAALACVASWSVA